jgi:hypothetical protein
MNNYTILMKFAESEKLRLNNSGQKMILLILFDF